MFWGECGDGPEGETLEEGGQIKVSKRHAQFVGIKFLSSLIHTHLKCFEAFFTYGSDHPALPDSSHHAVYFSAVPTSQ